MKYLLPSLFLVFVSNGLVNAQLFQRLDFPVTVNGTALSSAWTGGVNAPQWSAVDLDNDGKLDLYAFDREGNMHLTFLNTGGPDEIKYEFAPQFLGNFPVVRHFVLLRDYNHDGAMDLFASSKDEAVQGLKVFKGRFENNHLAFDRVEFNNWVFQVLTIPAGNGVTNLYVPEPDYPAIEDIDGDGDLDILSMNSVSANLVTFFKNMAVENGLTADTLVFKAEDYCWGEFFIPAITDSLVLSCHPDTCASQCFGGLEETDDRLHGSSTLAAFDNDNDGDMELLYGDLMYPKIIYAENGGDAQKAWMTSQDPYFPSYNAPVDLPFFPASFLFDLDNDGIKDYIVSPNRTGSQQPDRQVWFYKNYGSNEFPNFQLEHENIIVQDMLDFGKGAHPAFFDYNADGLLDLVVGNTSEWKKDSPNESYLVLLENTGTATEPAFELVDDDWLGFKQYSALTSGFAPTFGDLDGDGDEDLLVGERNGLLFYVENTAGAGNPATWTVPQYGWQNIIIGSYSTPFIYDMNKDGLPDLLIGEYHGTVNYLPNLGMADNPVFHPNPDEAPNNFYFGQINTQTASGPGIGFSAPVVLDFGDTVYVATGSQSGFIELYQVDFEKLESGAFEVVSEQFGTLREGLNSRIAFADLNADTLLDAVVGNQRGGLGVFSSPFTLSGEVPSSEVPEDLGVHIYPIPVGDYLRVQVKTSAFGELQYTIFDALGRQMGQGSFSAGQTAAVAMVSFHPGVYFIKIQAGQSMAVRSFVKQ